MTNKSVKILSSYNEYILEDKINEFLCEVDGTIGSIQYQVVAANDGRFEYSALIFIYD